MVSLAVVIAILLIQVPTLIDVVSRPNWNGYGAADFSLYRAATERWLATGVFYQPSHVTAPYTITFGDILYPPVVLWLLVPFTLLPPVLWWSIPLGITAMVVWQLRPGPLAWPVMAAIAGWQPVQIHLIGGNPDLWALAAMSLGTLYRWPAVFVLIKPSIGIFALFGARDRRWWHALALFCAISLPFLPMWLDWLSVVLNSRGGGLAYSWQEAPMLLFPLVAWLARPGGRYDIERRGM